MERESDDDLFILDDVVVKEEPTIDDEETYYEEEEKFVSSSDVPLEIKLETSSPLPFPDGVTSKMDSLLNSLEDNMRDPHCGICYKKMLHLYEFIESHTAPKIPCDFCEKSFASVTSLQTHMRVHIKSSSKYQPECRVQHPQHYTKRRPSANLFKCPFCPRKCISNSQLRNHLASHSNERPFVCAICRKGFKLKDALTQHVQIHDKNRPKFECQICSGEYGCIYYFRKHLKKIHKITNTHPYEQEAIKYPDYTRLPEYRRAVIVATDDLLHVLEAGISRNNIVEWHFVVLGDATGQCSAANLPEDQTQGVNVHSTDGLEASHHFRRHVSSGADFGIVAQVDLPGGLHVSHCQSKVSNHARSVQANQDVLGLEIAMGNRGLALLPEDLRVQRSQWIVVREQEELRAGVARRHVRSNVAEDVLVPQQNCAVDLHATPHLAVPPAADDLHEGDLLGQRALDEQRQATARARGHGVLQILPERAVAGRGDAQDVVAGVVRLGVRLVPGHQQSLVPAAAHPQVHHHADDAQHGHERHGAEDPLEARRRDRVHADHLIDGRQLGEAAVVAVVARAALDVVLPGGVALRVAALDVGIAQHRQLVVRSRAAPAHPLHAVAVAHAGLPALNGILAQISRVVRLQVQVVLILIQEASIDFTCNFWAKDARTMDGSGVKGSTSDFILPPFCVKQEGQFAPISPPDFMFVDHFLGLDPANMSMKLMSLSPHAKAEHHRAREPAGGSGEPAGGAPVKKEPAEEGGKVYQCPVCMRMFTNSYHLKRHHLIHTGEKPYMCTMCQMKFNRNEHLKRHILTHTNSRPFLCPACQKTFTRNEYLKRHKMIHTGERPYKCIFCSNRFSRNDHLKKHLARIHKVTQPPSPFLPHHLPPPQPLSLVTTPP
ncbi:uncharacterized protein LOC132256782 [Phlebotomus argentipes]|uniref:uncharacterized protein LOC132256782 n=1 Tax=Phlebotomus argentipes TaxID=94469 RepID=UPI0028933AEF|nr:uncharacterized protein LOC132256782 [Phlebotomus argentipes]